MHSCNASLEVGCFPTGMETSIYLPKGKKKQVLDGETKGMSIYTDKKCFQTEASLSHQLLGQYTKGNISYIIRIFDHDLKKFLLEI